MVGCVNLAVGVRMTCLIDRSFVGEWADCPIGQTLVPDGPWLEGCAVEILG
jgi:hypothetical protein